MKSKNLILILIISLISTTFLVACSNTEEGPEELTFEDKEFREQLLTWLDLRFPDSHKGTITEERLRQYDLTKLPILNYANISSIEDIKKLPYLEEVSIIGSEQLKDYSPLHNLKMLKDLKLINFKNGAFENLENIPSLMSLDISNNPDINLDFLKKFPNLTYLNVNADKLTNLNEIKELKNLERLDISSNNIVSFNDLSDFEKLKIVDIRDNPINNLRWLTKLKNDRLTVIMSSDIYDELIDDKLLDEIQSSEEKNIKILNNDEIKIDDVLTTNKILEETGIKVYVN